MRPSSLSISAPPAARANFRPPQTRTHERADATVEFDRGLALGGAGLRDGRGLQAVLSAHGLARRLCQFQTAALSDLRAAPMPRFDLLDADKYNRITVKGCFILRLDGDTPDVFHDVLRFVRESGLFEVQITFLTAFPRTPLYP